MGLFNSIRMGSSGAGGGYEVDRSLRFNNDDSAYLNIQYAQEPTSQYKMTFSCWVKRCSSDSGVQAVIGVEDNWESPIGFSNDSFRAVAPNSSVTYITTAKYRDFSAWMHVMTVYDTQNSTGADRMICYINGERLTDFSTSGTVPQNTVSARALRSGYNTYIAKDGVGAYGDMYCAEVNVIDGQALTPSDFTETDSITGQLIPKEYTGSYGTNGFYLNFSDNSGTTATTLGKDSSGNGNNFTPNNFVTGDAVKDSPTNNFCTLNPLNVAKYRGQASFSQGNLRMTSTSGNRGFTTGTIKAQGKIYFEVLNKSNSGFVGISDITGDNYQRVDFYNGTPRIDGSTLSNTGQFSSGDIMGVKVDIDAKSIEFFRNNSSIFSATYTTDVEYFPFLWDPSGGRSTDATANFGQDSSFAGEKTAQGNTDANGIGDFYYSVPAGYKALCSSNLPDSTILLPNKHFDTQLWSGYTADGRQIANLEFQPDLVWWKTRNNTNAQYTVDSVRGVDKQLRPEGTMAETNYSERLESFISGGFTVGTDGDVQHASNNYVAWNWKGGGTASSNSDGTITSSVSANTSAGFSIVTYTATGSAGATVGHGLGVKPDVIITKRRNSTSNWGVYHSVLGAGKSAFLNTTGVPIDNTVYYNDTEPTSTVFTLGASNESNAANSDTYIAYCFSGVEGYSKFGKYEGNGNSDGTFVYLGFTPAWVMYKNIEQDGGQWFIRDTKRHPDNPNNISLVANSDTAETDSSLIDIDLVSNGIKWRETNEGSNNNGIEYIYLAFAESPFKYSRAR